MLELGLNGYDGLKVTPVGLVYCYNGSPTTGPQCPQSFRKVHTSMGTRTLLCTRLFLPSACRHNHFSFGHDGSRREEGDLCAHAGKEPTGPRVPR